MKRVAVFPGTFDPITFGHVELVERTLSLFDEVVIAVAMVSGKQTLYTLDQRLKQTRAVFKDNTAIKVDALDGLLVDFVQQWQQQGHQVTVVRGVRNVMDFESEKQQFLVNRLALEYETIFLPTEGLFADISSTLVRQMILAKTSQSRLEQWVPKEVFSC